MNGENALELEKLKREMAEQARDTAELRFEVAVLRAELDLVSAILWPVLSELPAEVRDRLTTFIDDRPATMSPLFVRVRPEEELRYSDRVNATRGSLRKAVEVRPYDRGPSSAGTPKAPPAMQPPPPPHGLAKWVPPVLLEFARWLRTGVS